MASASIPIGLRPVLAALLLALAAPAAAQQADDLSVDATTRDRLVAFVAQRVGERYVNPAVGLRVSGEVMALHRAGRYGALGNASALTDTLTADLRRIGGDSHLQVVFSVRPRPMSAGGAPSPDETRRQREAAAARNFGWHRVERLDGNVGYIEVGRFEPLDDAGPVMAAAMQFLSNTDALIVDLQTNGGGHAQTVNAFVSYFLPPGTHVSTLHRRDPADSVRAVTDDVLPAPRYLDRPVFVLTAARTYSGAEGFTYGLRMRGRATVVGERTRGGANPGEWQQMNEHFAVFVPTARVADGVTGGNWEGTGIQPDIAAAPRDGLAMAHASALEKLLAERPDSPRAPMWREALERLRARASAP
jgi:C-terminal processing protease CtpA/Prc